MKSNDKLKKRVTKIAQNLMSRKSYSADAHGVRHEIKDFIDKNGVYVVCRVWLFGDDGFILVSGNIHRVGTYIEVGIENKTIQDWRVVGITSDRNEARKLGDEV